MSVFKLPGSAIQANTISTTQLQTTVVNQISAGGGPRVSSLVYPGNDTAGNTVGGQTVYIVGSGFETNNAIYINGNAVPSKSFISASNLSFTTPALSAGIYPVYVINTDSGATAIFVPGYISSAEPTWVTSAGSLSGDQDELSAWSYSLSATGDAPITYALAAGSSLPTGVSLAANGLISGTISSPTGNVTTYTFSVVATDAQNQDSTRQFTVTTSTGEGVLFANNVLLIHADGTNNGNNHAFLDSSNNNFTITRYGNATQGTFSPFSQTGWSAYFDGTGDYLSDIGAGSSFNFMHNTTALFTFECWLYKTTQNSGTAFIFCNNGGASASIGISLSFENDVPYLFITRGVSASPVCSLSGVGSFPMNRWTHLAITYDQSLSSNNAKIYINGTLNAQGSKTGNAPSNSNATNSLNIAGISGNYFYAGYMSNFRITNTIVYSSNFTPPVAPLTAIANTSLLTLQSNRFIDNSTNAFTITRNGDVSIQAFSPFAPTASYSSANVGGSVYLDGTGDYLAAPDNSALEPENSDLTWEMWIKTTSSTQYATLYSRTPSPFNTGMWSLMINEASSTTGDIALYMHEYSPSTYLFRTTGVNIRDDAWHHIAVVRSGSSWVCYVDGVSRATATWSGTTSNIAGGPYVGADQNYGRNFIGYISGLRIVKGTAVYTGAFTPPTAPPTNIANTSLLCNFTNAGIFDQTAKNVLETVGDAKVSTAQYKYGTGSIAFDGTGDYLTIAANPLLAFGTGDFTVEFWFRSTDGDGNLIGITTNAAGNWNLVLASSSLYWQSQYAQTNLYNRSATGILDGNWHHIAITRASGTSRMFFDGTQQGVSVSDSTSYAAAHAMQIGSSGVYGDIAANIDDLRITKGYARYTSNFTPPTSALKDR